MLRILYLSLIGLFSSVWDFVCSSEASNFGTFLLGFTSSVGITVSGCFYFFRVRKEKRLEKRSNIAEESLITLEIFMGQFTVWASKASTWFIFSKHSKANKLNYQQATEEQKHDLNKMYDEDPYELNNFCDTFGMMMKDFFRAKTRAFLLENQTLDKQFEEMESLLQKFPRELCSFHQLKDSEDTWPKKGSQIANYWDFISREGLHKVGMLSDDLKSRLRKIILYK